MKKLLKLIIFILIILVCIYVYKEYDIKNKVLKKFYPIKYKEYIEKYADEYEIDKLLIYSIIKAESNFDPTVKSKSGAIGLMQLMPNTACEIDPTITEDKLYDEETNIKLGICYFSKLLKHYNNSIELSIVAYNAGMGTVDKWIEEGILNEDGSNIENTPYKESNNYVRKILRDYKIYKDLYKEEIEEE